MKNNIYQYDIIGFDMDFCLLEYKFEEFAKMMWNFITSELEKINYPKFPLFDDIYQKTYNYYFKCVLDIKNGQVLKVGEKGQILKCFKGFQKLNTQKIQEIYGQEGILENFIFDDKTHQEDYVLIADYFQCQLLPVYMFIISIKENYEFLQKKSFKKIYEDIRISLIKAQEDAYDNYYTKNFQTLYNQELYYHPEKYIIPISEEIKQNLLKLRQSGKIVFLISNNKSHKGPKILECAMGKNYQDYFDFLIFEAKKPNFMFDEIEEEFYDCNTEKIVDFENLENKLIKKGDLKKLNSFFAKKNPNFKGLIFEDNLYNGFNKKHKIENLKNWDYALIFKELSETEEEINCTNKLQYKKKLGSQLIGKNVKGNFIPTFFINFINKYTQYSFSSMKSEKLQKFMQKNKQIIIINQLTKDFDYSIFFKAQIQLSPTKRIIKLSKQVQLYKEL